MPLPFYAWKFLVPIDAFYPDPVDPSLAHRGAVAVVLAIDEAQARKRLELYAAENGLDPRWLRAARVRRIELVEAGVLCWVQT